MTAVHSDLDHARDLHDTLILHLRSSDATDRSITGGKAARLAELSVAGFPVPTGFVVTTTAFDSVIDVAAGEPDAGLRDIALAAAVRTTPLGAAIRAAYATLGGTVAVRSSGVAEDLSDASFAGQYESYLNLSDVESVMDAVASCVASAFTDRVRTYRAEHSIATTRMAVLVQRMVPARAAGVAFSAHPISGARDVVVVSAVGGVGEALVSGQSDAEEWEIHDGIASRRRVTVPVLSENDALAVSRLATTVAAGTPTDIEWAFDGDQLHLLQARPMTNMPEPVRWEAPHPGGWLRNFRLGEWIGAPVTPLFESWLLTDIERGMHRHWEKLFGVPVEEPLHVIVNGWYFYGMNLPSSRWVIARSLFITLRNLFGPHRAQMLAASPPTAHMGFDRELERWRTSLLPAYRELVARSERDVDSVPVGELPALIDRLINAVTLQMTSIIGVAGYAAKMEMKLAMFWRKHLATHGGAWLDLVVDGDVAPAAHDVEGLDWYFPTLGERGALPSTVSETTRAALHAKRDAATQRARDALPVRQHKAFDALVKEARRAHRVRQEQTSQTTLAWPCLRQGVHRLAHTLVNRGQLRAVIDVYFLRREELFAMLLDQTLHVDVASRRATWERQRRLAPPLLVGALSGFFKKIFDEGEQLLNTEEHAAADALRGMPGSPGRVTGPARVIRSVDELWRLQPGEILVAPVTTPGWTPAFARAIGIVTDTGSIASHASIVAREYGIPAVVGTAEATARICDGQLITVDGALGVVRLGGGT